MKHPTSSDQSHRLAGIAAELGKRDAIVVLEQEAYLSVVRTASRLGESFDRLFREHGLSHPLYNVLRIVAGHEPDGATAQRIGEHLISRGPDVTRLVTRLDSLGLVSRHDCDRDARCRYVRLTPEGRAKLDQLDPLVLDLHRRQLGHLSSDDLRMLCQLLSRARKVQSPY